MALVRGSAEKKRDEAVERSKALFYTPDPLFLDVYNESFDPPRFCE